jgi:hypothetical protein
MDCFGMPSYITSHRVLAPSIVAHFPVSFFAEPGLVLGALKGKMSGNERFEPRRVSLVFDGTGKRLAAALDVIMPDGHTES